MIYQDSVGLEASVVLAPHSPAGAAAHSSPPSQPAPPAAAGAAVAPVNAVALDKY